MRLSPREIEKLMLHNAGFLAQKRYARGLKLNYVESMALISSQILEYIREGNSVSELMDKGKKMLGLDDVMEGVAGMIYEVQVEGTFPDGTKLVTVHDPICDEKGQPELALYGSGLHYSPTVQSPDNISAPIPAETFISEGIIQLNIGRKSVEISVLNKGDRPIQIGSHYPFVESNRALDFNRTSAYGMRLDIPAGTAVRFEPGESKTVSLVEIAGEKIMKGGSGIVSGPIEGSDLSKVTKALTDAGFSHTE